MKFQSVAGNANRLKFQILMGKLKTGVFIVLCFIRSRRINYSVAIATDASGNPSELAFSVIFPALPDT